MKNDRSYLDVFQRIIELSKGDNASNNIKNYLLRCDWDTIKVVQTAVYLGEDEGKISENSKSMGNPENRYRRTDMGNG